MTLDQAIEKIKRNTRVYSKKQVTWYKKDPDMHWFSPDDKRRLSSISTGEVNRICLFLWIPHRVRNDRSLLLGYRMTGSHPAQRHGVQMRISWR